MSESVSHLTPNPHPQPLSQRMGEGGSGLTPERKGSAKKSALAAAGEPFIDKAEAARRLGKQTRTMDDWMKRGIIPFYKMGHSVAFRWSEVQEHLARTCKVWRGGKRRGMTNDE